MQVENIKKDFLEDAGNLFLMVDIITTLPDGVRRGLKVGKIGVKINGNLFSYEQFGEITKPSGIIWQWATKACIVTIYHLWEEHYRKQFADVATVKKDDIEWELMGTMREIRNSIIHTESKAEKIIENENLGIKFAKNDPIKISEESWGLLKQEMEKIEIEVKKCEYKKL